MLAIHAFLEAIAKLIDLVRERREVDRRLFDDHVEPIFQSMRQIAKDYLRLFASVNSKLRDRQVPVAEALRYLETSRAELAPLRSEMTRYAAALLESRQPQAILHFATRCYELISVDQPGGAVRWHGVRVVKLPVSAGTSLLQKLEDRIRTHLADKGVAVQAAAIRQLSADPEELRDLPREALAEISSAYLSNVGHAWQSVQDDYFWLRVHSLR